jgi:hypothetical protein
MSFKHLRAQGLHKNGPISNPGLLKPSLGPSYYMAAPTNPGDHLLRQSYPKMETLYYGKVIHKNFIEGKCIEAFSKYILYSFRDISFT